MCLGILFIAELQTTDPAEKSRIDLHYTSRVLLRLTGILLHWNANDQSSELERLGRLLEQPTVATDAAVPPEHNVI